MNTSIQCLSHTLPLTYYFLKNTDLDMVRNINMALLWKRKIALISWTYVHQNYNVSLLLMSRLPGLPVMPTLFTENLEVCFHCARCFISADEFTKPKIGAKCVFSRLLRWNMFFNQMLWPCCKRCCCILFYFYGTAVFQFLTKTRQFLPNNKIQINRHIASRCANCLSFC